MSLSLSLSVSVVAIDGMHSGGMTTGSRKTKCFSFRVGVVVEAVVLVNSDDEDDDDDDFTGDEDCIWDVVPIVSSSVLLSSSSVSIDL
mmetsp:Transcript_18751/g.21003  ORF Transcript_18751/g.21003 Transcript_18751/m.21003 type:complete len:88 (+) Transcript_18751:442-705(+)|eukprot:CAMPEP_0171018588 /NCGR_PEP_ID=MMETSP0736-20130129/28452_1 /TAXON_ID=186038 /ORGANISM="Fragilariopsis kerguelensis, Strain L26-C5" /LENGTH=87 /DNA_ID=CAMNT_0011455313 /DNA_START=369 /DNA_END=632 /DNA_ORIENTATION=-